MSRRNLQRFDYKVFHKTGKKVGKKVTAEAFDQLAEKTYHVTREELLRACVLDCLK